MQALQDSRSQLNGNCPTSSTGNDIMGSVADKVKEINLSEDSGIESPTGDVNTEISRNEKVETSSDRIIKNEVASVKDLEEIVLDATQRGACKAAGKT